MTKQERIKMIIEYATKVIQYPKGSAGYDPVDLVNLEDAIEKYNNESELPLFSMEQIYTKINRLYEKATVRDSQSKLSFKSAWNSALNAVKEEIKKR